MITQLTDITKLGYHDPRPFWVNPEINAYSCTSQYGNPSGHSSSSMGIAMMLWLDFAFTTENPLWSKILLFFTAVGFGVSIMYSRMFLGVHSLD